MLTWLSLKNPLRARKRYFNSFAITFEQCVAQKDDLVITYRSKVIATIRLDFHWTARNTPEDASRFHLQPKTDIHSGVPVPVEHRRVLGAYQSSHLSKPQVHL